MFEDKGYRLICIDRKCSKVHLANKQIDNTTEGFLLKR